MLFLKKFYQHFQIYFTIPSIIHIFLTQLRDCELGAIVNRDLSRRIRSVNGLTSHKQIVRHDIKLSAKIVHNLDNRVGLWNEEKKDESAKQEDDKENKTTESNHEVEQAVSKLCAIIYIKND